MAIIGWESYTWDRELQNMVEEVEPQLKILLCGRSGVGKSSLVNSLLGRVVCKVSLPPGVSGGNLRPCQGRIQDWRKEVLAPAKFWETTPTSGQNSSILFQHLILASLARGECGTIPSYDCVN